MRKVFTVAVTFGALLTIASFLSMMHVVVQDAEAYVLLACKQPNVTALWRSMNLTATDLADTKLSYANWNDGGQNIELKQTSSSEHIQMYSVNRPDWGDTDGITLVQCSGSTIISPTETYINDANTNGYSSQGRQSVIAHEIGHQIGLNHSDVGTSNEDEKTLMYSTDINYVTYNIFVPVLDDIRGGQAWYGTLTSTSECTEFNSNGDVIYTGTCSSSYPALPMTEKVTTAGFQSRAFASQFSTGQNLPSVGTVLMTTKVKAITLYRFSVGIHTNNNVADQGTRFGTVELDNDGIKAVYNNAGGGLSTITMWSGTPSTTTTYFLQLVVQNGKPAAAYAYKDDGGGSTPPTFMGKASFTPGIGWNSFTVFYGTGVWTDSSSNPRSEYQVSQYFNRLKSYI